MHWLLEDQDTKRAGKSSATTTVKIPADSKKFNVASPLPLTTGGSGPLNRTSFVAPVQWQLQYNSLSDFEIIERAWRTHIAESILYFKLTCGRIVIAVVAVTLPILLSVTRLLLWRPNSRYKQGFSTRRPVRYSRRSLLGEGLKI